MNEQSIKPILILGAGSDIAQALAMVYAKSGYSLVLATKTPEALEAFAQDLRIRHATVVELKKLDVSDFNTHQAFINSLPPVLAGVICAVGYLGNQQTAQSISAELRSIAITNYVGVVALLEPLAAQLEAQRSGFFVVIGSVAGDRGRQSNYHYGAAKAALSTYLSGLRNRLFRVNVAVLEVRPGFVDTKMTAHLKLPNGLTAQPRDVAARILKAQQNKADIIYVKPIWRLIMWLIRSIPEAIFKRLNL